ncbi:5'-nucleotidase, lipoprotein e(P4) family [Pediococcus acidilactici D3]|nr:5'-nucleotidase, lipoprotein e(P4) family [Pediococcus acidilactici D3]
MNYANEQGVQIYYVSDREQSQLKATIKNLTAEGLPQADREHILLKQKQDKTKEQRRQQVAHTATTEIYTLSLHDALPIFDSLFQK